MKITTEKGLKSKVEALESSVESQFPCEVSLFYREHLDAMVLSAIHVPKGERGIGIGSKVMNKIVDFADEYKLIVVLSPSKDFGATSVSRLRKFYGKFGFVRNLGGKKNYQFPEAMIRYPATPVLGILATTFVPRTGVLLSASILTASISYDLGDGLELSAVGDSWRLYKKDQEGLLLSAQVRRLPISEIPALNDILVYPGGRGQGLGRIVLKKLIEHYGSLRSDDQGRTSDGASKMWKSVGAESLNRGSKGFGGSWYAMKWSSGKPINIEVEMLVPTASTDYSKLWNNRVPLFSRWPKYAYHGTSGGVAKDMIKKFVAKDLFMSFDKSVVEDYLKQWGETRYHDNVILKIDLSKLDLSNQSVEYDIRGLNDAFVFNGIIPSDAVKIEAVGYKTTSRVVASIVTVDATDTPAKKILKFDTKTSGRLDWDKDLLPSPRRAVELSYMSPKEFLTKTDSRRYITDSTKIDKYYQMLLESNIAIPTPVIVWGPLGKAFNSEFHDGQHRVMALDRLGVQRIPVLLVTPIEVTAMTIDKTLLNAYATANNSPFSLSTEITAMNYTGKTFSLNIAGMKTAFLVKKVQSNEAVVLDVTGKDTSIALKYLEEWLRDGHLKQTDKLKVAAASGNSLEKLLEQIRKSGLKFYSALWTDNTDNVYLSYFVAKTPKKWESHKPSAFPGGYVLFYAFVGDISEFGSSGGMKLSKNDEKQVEKEMADFFKQKKLELQVIGVKSTEGQVTLNFQDSKGGKFNAYVSDDGSTGTGSKNSQVTYHEVANKLYDVLEPFLPKTSEKQFLGAPDEVDIAEVIELAEKASNQKEIIKRLDSIVKGEANFHTNIKYSHPRWTS